MKNNLALIGKNISHSKSPYVYKEVLKINCEYDLLDYVSEKEIPPLIKLLQKYNGISITAPYKRFIYQKCDLLDLSAERSMSVNCIKLEDDKVKGTNTDYLALEKILKDVESHNICILGNGAMATTVRLILDERNIKYESFYRSKDINLNNLDYRKFNFIINTCSREFEFNAQVENNSTFYDLNYSHSVNRNSVLKHKANYKDGFELLVEQARQALEFWAL